ncbi:MAG: AsmA family protein [Winogradskyella sp.]|nr:MAG: AsmA family protein [Winogradskyella sp.]
MKKVFKIIGILLLIFIVLLISIPFFLESKIDTIVQNYADENLNAELSFDDINLSLISSFPKAEISIENLKINTLAPFEDETLVSAKAISFEMPVGELLKGSEQPLVVNEIIADELLLSLKTNTAGNVNYDIVKSKGENTNTAKTTSESFSFDIEHYELNNSAFTYIDEDSNTKVYVTEINHNGNGIFSGDVSELETKTDARISLSADSTEYLSNNSIKLDALIDLDLEQNKYTFKENKGYINALPLEFEGFVKLVEKGQEMDLSFKNPEASFKDFLAVIPKEYTKDIANVETTGDFTVNGIIKGLISDETIPHLDININSDNASFKYPELPKKVENIIIDTSIKNTTGNVEDTYIDINTLNFKIDEDVFKSEAHIKNLTGNTLVNTNLDGVLNLANITKAYPVELENQLSGILRAKMNTSFDMHAIETNAYQRIKNNGTVSVEDFIFSSEDIVNPIQINTADLSFKPGMVTLNKFEALTGNSDLYATGVINNLLGFLISDKKLQGDFKVTSDNFVVSDFMIEDETAIETSNKTTSDTESLKIPDFLDCLIHANAQNVVYDNLNLKNVNGKLRIKDQNANLINMTTDLFDGKLGISGNVSTKDTKPKFDMELAMQQFDVSKSFKGLDLLNALAPIAKVVQGKLNSTIKLNGLLDENFAPVLNSISGDALAEILTTKLTASQSETLKSLGGKFDFIDFNDLDLKDLKTKLSFEDGQVSVKPFTINYKDIPIEVSGTHSFANTMDYNAVLNVPAKYLGNDVNNLIQKINDDDVNKITIPVTAKIGGSFTKPNVTSDLTSGVSQLTKQLIEIQKQKLIGKGTDKLSNLLGDVIGGNTNKTKDSTQVDSSEATPKDPIKDDVKSIFGGLLNKKKKKKDSTKN